MTHFVLLQHMVLQNMHRNNKRKSLQRSKNEKYADFIQKNQIHAYIRYSAMQTQSILGSKLFKNCISFPCFKHFMPSCYTYMTWLLHNVMPTAASAGSGLPKTHHFYVGQCLVDVFLSILHKSRKCVCGKV